jgi:DNA mismatch repair ATPase MutS
MKTYLLDRNGVKHITEGMSWNGETIVMDLGLKPIIEAMASGDEYLFKNSLYYLLNSVQSTDEIVYRQEILRDFINNPRIAKEIYRNAVSFITEAQKQFFWFSNNDSLSMQVSIDIIKLFAEYIGKIRNVIDSNSENIRSEGFKKFYDVVSARFDKEYMELVTDNLERLQFKDGITLSVSLGPGNEGKNYILHKPDAQRKNMKSIMGDAVERHYTYTLPERDISGGEEITDIRNRGIREASLAMRKSAKNSMKFFKDIRSEIGFYMSSLNLLEKIKEKGGSICFPEPAGPGDDKLAFSGLYDLGLLLGAEGRVVSNNLEGDNIKLFVITGTNRGGKSTFIRSMGQAQLMMQSGIFVPAEGFSGNIVTGVFSHFKHEEDATMERGKFDDELSVMNEIAQHIRKNGMMLFNESFSSTNTREGSNIAMQITNALMENGIKIFFVSHLYEFASAMMEMENHNSMFLVAERTGSGKHTYKIIEGKPSVTGYGMDLYRKIFG